MLNGERIGPPRRPVLGLAALAAAALLMVACQQEKPVLSVAEAKKVTATTFEEPQLTPPPRTIGDITAILDKEKQADPEAAARARAKAHEKPPAGADDRALAWFYLERSKAATEIGDVRQQIADLTEAERLSRDLRDNLRGSILWQLGHAQRLAGNRSIGQRYMEQAVALVPPKRKVQVVSRNAAMAAHLANVGDLDGADRTFAMVMARFEDLKTGFRWPEMENQLSRSVYRAEGRILFAKGRFADAEAAFRKAMVFADRLAKDRGRLYDGFVADNTRSALARALLRQGRMVEAEVEARKSVISSLKRRGRYHQETAFMLTWLTAIIGAQGRAAEAEKLARAVIDIYRQIGAPDDSFMVAAARRALGRILVDQDKWTEALAEYETIKTALTSDPQAYERFFSRNLDWALALLGAGRAAEAEAIAAKALERRRRVLGPKHGRTALAEGVLAMALARQDKRWEALEAFGRAVPILLRRMRHFDNADSRGGTAKRWHLILDAYIALLSQVRGTPVEKKAGFDAAAEAFRIAGVARGQSVQQALAASAARASVKDPVLADLVRREQDAGKQLGAAQELLADMLSVPTSEQDPKVVEGLRNRIETLSAAQAALLAEIEKGYPDYAGLLGVKPVTIGQARRVLAPGEALIATYTDARRTYVWAVPKTGPTAFAAAPLGREDLSDAVDSLRADLEPDARTLGDIPPFDVAAAYDLYAKLLAPVAPGWKDAKSLLVAAHGALGYLPLSLLPTRKVALGPETKPLFSNYRQVPWLARTHAVTMLPSVASLGTLRGLPKADTGRKPFAGFGDPWFNEKQAAQAQAAGPRQVAAATGDAVATRGAPVRLRAAPEFETMDSAELAMLPRLPDTADEVASMARAMNAGGAGTVFTGPEASEDRVKAMDLADFRVVAFATHGLVPGDLDGLQQPALALSSPKVTGGKDDGLLTMGEVLGLRLNADWVVLSACNTGTGSGAGAEAVSGLGQAFFYAGTRALLVSNWPVETTSAKALTTGLFHRQAAEAGLSRAEALRRAMIDLIDKAGYVDPATGHVVYAYAHPLFWAPFSLIGDGGGRRPGT